MDRFKKEMKTLASLKCLHFRGRDCEGSGRFYFEFCAVCAGNHIRKKYEKELEAAVNRAKKALQ